MPTKKEKAMAVFKEVKGNRQEFLDLVVRRKIVGAGYAGTLYQLFKGPKNQRSQTQQRQSQQLSHEIKTTSLEQQESTETNEDEQSNATGLSRRDLQVQTLTPENIEQEAGETLSEDSDLKDSWGRMLNTKKQSVLKNVDDKPPSGNQSNQNKVGGGATSGTKSSGKLSYNPGHLLGMAIKDINNKILWEERPLSAENNEMIDGLAQDVNSRRFEGAMEGENSDIGMLLLAGFGIPALENIDLIPKKAEGVVRWFKEMRDMWNGGPAPNKNNGEKKEEIKPPPDVIHANVTPPNSGSPAPAPAPTPPSPATPPADAKFPANMKNWDTFPSNVQSWLTDEYNKGCVIDPNYRNGTPLDWGAYTGRGIIKNNGSEFQT